MIRSNPSRFRFVIVIFLLSVLFLIGCTSNSDTEPATVSIRLNGSIKPNLPVFMWLSVKGITQTKILLSP